MPCRHSFGQESWLTKFLWPVFRLDDVPKPTRLQTSTSNCVTWFKTFYDDPQPSTSLIDCTGELYSLHGLSRFARKGKGAWREYDEVINIELPGQSLASIPNPYIWPTSDTTPGSTRRNLQSEPVGSSSPAPTQEHWRKTQPFNGYLEDAFARRIVDLVHSNITDVESLLEVLALAVSYARLTQKDQSQTANLPPETAEATLTNECVKCYGRLKDRLPKSRMLRAVQGFWALGIWEGLVDVARQHVRYLEEDRLRIQRESTVKGFLDFPPEIRNAMYSYFLLNSIAVKECGLIWTCKQIRDELSSMIISHARNILEQTAAESTRLRTPVCKSLPSAPYIVTPSVTKLMQLNSVNLAISMDHSTPVHFPPSLGTGQGQRKVTFCEAFAVLERILSLHLPFVTILLFIEYATAIFWGGRLWYECLNVCYWVFKHYKKEWSINVRVVIFDLSCNMDGPYYSPGHQPYIAFVARITKKGVRFEFYGNEPRPWNRGIANIDGVVRPYAIGKDMRRLDCIVRMARSLGEHNQHNKEQRTTRLKGKEVVDRRTS